MAGMAERRGTSMASAAAILMVGFILSRLLGLVRVAIQASVFSGVGHDAAAFTTAIAIPDTVFTLVSGGALGSSFIPVFGALLERGDERDAWRVASGVMNGVLVVMTIAVLIAEVFAPAIVGLMAAPPDRALTLTLTRIMLLQPLFLTVSGILMGIHNSYHRFLAPAIAPIIYNVANIIGLLLVPIFHHAVTFAAWGVTVGALVQVVILTPGLSPLGRAIRPKVGLDEAGTREVGRLMVPRIIGQAGIQVTGLVTIALANLNFSDRPSLSIRLAANLMALPVGILGSSIATASFPTLTRQAARGDHAALGTTLSRALSTIVFLSTPAAVALVILRYPVVNVLFRHGAFQAHSADLVASSLLMYAVAIPAWAAIELLPRVFFAMKDTWTPVLVNLVTLVVAVALSLLGVWLAHGDAVLGVGLLTAALSVTVVLEAVWLGLLIRRRIDSFTLNEPLLSLLHSLVASAAMAVVLLALLYLWSLYGPDTVPGSLLLLLLAAPLGIGSYCGWAYVIEAPELDAAIKPLRRRLSKEPRG